MTRLPPRLPITPPPFPIRAWQSVWRLYCYAVPESLRIVRQQGWRELLRRRGWKFFAAIVVYDLLRDTLIYIVIPVGIARGLF